MRSRFVLVVLFFVLGPPLPVHAGEIVVLPTHSFELTSNTGSVGGLASVDVLLNNLDFTGDWVEAFQYAVCNDPTLVTPTAVLDGAALPPEEPWYYEVSYEADQVFVAYLVDSSIEGIPPGSNRHLNTIWYSLNSPGTQPLCFCDYDHPSGTVQSPIMVIAGLSVDPYLYCGTMTATTTFRRGDANGDGTYDLADAIHTLGVLFGGGSFDTCEMAADANDDSQVDLGDAVFSLTHFFGDGPGPALGCGIDDTPDSLTCDEYGACM